MRKRIHILNVYVSEILEFNKLLTYINIEARYLTHLLLLRRQ